MCVCVCVCAHKHEYAKYMVQVLHELCLVMGVEGPSSVNRASTAIGQRPPGSRGDSPQALPGPGHQGVGRAQDPGPHESEHHPKLPAEASPQHREDQASQTAKQSRPGHALMRPAKFPGSQIAPKWVQQRADSPCN